ncbi:MAG TPA: 3'-5' exonuclease [Bacteroidales bacterium]|jgi:ribonuclease D|nr:3'-5' exonuclease domain-containing protein 2 [Bacteroidales bacterium]MDI9574560.1 3'-5' exonuclease [Bacteroidota bacterium]OQC59668.1 MAG: Ribonuclease D [Bacteroidetes bacterium ADurb.Bin012]NMD16846.1 3'-5' exonuclease domain-containing protein 2 [Bacteroidales bacterium]HNQ60239.1 3'-5' exonuclease [Bacteroidales bacterium]
MQRGLIVFSMKDLERMKERVAHLPMKIEENEISVLPVAEYQGEIVVIERLRNLSQALEEIYSWGYVGFDTETRPNFHKGENHKPALMQVAGARKTFLFRLNKLGFPPLLRSFISDENIIKVGLALENDLPELTLHQKFSPAGMVDLNQLCPQLGFQNIGARKLTAIFLKVRLKKSQQTSNWENSILTEAQLKYAALDSWICREIYSILMGIV